MGGVGFKGAQVVTWVETLVGYFGLSDGFDVYIFIRSLVTFEDGRGSSLGKLRESKYWESCLFSETGKLNFRSIGTCCKEGLHRCVRFSR
jgi:hypothetical protein